MITNTFNNIKQFNYLIIFRKGFYTNILKGYKTIRNKAQSKDNYFIYNKKSEFGKEWVTQ